MRIRFSKANGVPVLTCVRADGTSTYSKSRHGGFFGPHDLMHYAVETTLGYRSAFFGLIAGGRTIQSFDDREVFSTLPDEALHAEHLVNLLMSEQASGEARGAGAFNEALREAMSARRSDGKRTNARAVGPAPELSGAQLDAIRTRFAETLGAYRRLGEGEALEFEFPA